ncbi:hypothetical protein SDC9_205768 [bioreactor metagenome]|uniref:Uncharacterized protein n=1 Tax=bioreactor metagenome TaxID=1076179 RepID=A0A645J4K4_9ZZZZ
MFPYCLTDHLLVDCAGRRTDAFSLIQETMQREINIDRINTHLVDTPTLVDRIVGDTLIGQLLMLLHTHNPPLERTIRPPTGQLQPSRP